MKHSAVKLSTILTSALISFALPSSAGEYRGKCYFNSISMSCTVSQNPSAMTMRWADGVTETYIHKGNGVYVDKRGGIWRPATSVSKGEFWEHKNGNTIGFVEY